MSMQCRCSWHDFTAFNERGTIRGPLRLQGVSADCHPLDGWRAPYIYAHRSGESAPTHSGVRCRWFQEQTGGAFSMGAAYVWGSMPAADWATTWILWPHTPAPATFLRFAKENRRPSASVWDKQLFPLPRRALPARGARDERVVPTKAGRQVSAGGRPHVWLPSGRRAW